MRKIKCDACEYRGYSAELCKLHSTQDGSCDVPEEGWNHPLVKIGKAVVYGAGAGVAMTLAGIAVGPIIGFNALLGPAGIAKLSAGAGMAGAGVNVAQKWKKSKSKAKNKKRSVPLPMYLRG